MLLNSSLFGCCSKLAHGWPLQPILVFMPWRLRCARVEWTHSQLILAHYDGQLADDQARLAQYKGIEW